MRYIYKNLRWNSQWLTDNFQFNLDILQLLSSISWEGSSGTSWLISSFQRHTLHAMHSAAGCSLAFITIFGASLLFVHKEDKMWKMKKDSLIRHFKWRYMFSSTQIWVSFHRDWQSRFALTIMDKVQGQRWHRVSIREHCPTCFQFYVGLDFCFAFTANGC